MARSDDIFVRVAVPFVLTDARYLRLTGDQQSLWLFLEALALQERREILPERYTPQQVAFLIHRETRSVRADLRALGGPACRFVKVREDGRIRVVGVRRKHGDRFKWQPEPELSACPIPSRNGEHTVPIQPPNVREEDVDVDPESEPAVKVASGSENLRPRAETLTAGSESRTPERPTATDTSGNRRCTPMDADTATAKATARLATEAGSYSVKASSAIADITRGWNWAGFRNAKGLKDLVSERCHGTYDQALNCVACAFDAAKKGAHKAPGSLLHRLKRPRYPPTDVAVRLAKRALGGGETERTPRRHGDTENGRTGTPVGTPTERLGVVMREAARARAKRGKA